MMRVFSRLLKLPELALGEALCVELLPLGLMLCQSNKQKIKRNIRKDIIYMR